MKEGIKTSVGPLQALTLERQEGGSQRGVAVQVWLCKEIKTGKIVALKKLKKAEMVKRGQIDHVKAERDVLAGIHNPFIVRLYYSFQVGHPLELAALLACASHLAEQAGGSCAVAAAGFHGNSCGLSSQLLTVCHACNLRTSVYLPTPCMRHERSGLMGPVHCRTMTTCTW